ARLQVAMNDRGTPPVKVSEHARRIAKELEHVALAEALASASQARDALALHQSHDGVEPAIFLEGVEIAGQELVIEAAQNLSFALGQLHFLPAAGGPHGELLDDDPLARSQLLG